MCNTEDSDCLEGVSERVMHRNGRRRETLCAPFVLNDRKKYILMVLFLEASFAIFCKYVKT